MALQGQRKRKTPGRESEVDEKQHLLDTTLESIKLPRSLVTG
jgi:hypothetical protein